MGKLGVRRTGTYAGRKKSTATKTIQKAVRAKKARIFTKNVVRAVQTIAEKKKHCVLLTGTTLGGNSSSIYGNGLSLPTTVLPQYGFLIPNIWNQILIAQGEHNQQRVGNAITPTSLNLKGFISAMEWDKNTNGSKFPFEVHMLIYKNKLDSTGSPKTLVEDVNNTCGGITGSAENSLLTWNRKGYTIIKHRVFRFKPPPLFDKTAPFQMTDSNIGTGTVPINLTYGSSSNAMFQRFSVNIPTPKTVKYTDGSNQPTNTWCSVGFYIVNGDGKVLPSGQVRAEVYSVATLRYNDL